MIVDKNGKEIYEGDVLKEYILTKIHNHPLEDRKWDELCECPYEYRPRYADVVFENKELLVKYRDDGSKYDFNFRGSTRFEITNEQNSNR